MHRPRSTLVPLVLALSAVLAAAASVTITRDRAPVMDGKNVLTYLPKGQRVTVTRTNGPWYLVQVTVRGKARSGWIHKQSAKLDLPKPIHTPEPPGSEADAEKVFNQLKAKADKLAAEGKITEAIDVMDTFPPRFGKTKWQRKVLEYTLDLEKRQKPEKPEDLEKDAEDDYKSRRAEADQLAKEGKLEDAIEALKGFPAKFAHTKWAKEVHTRLLELQALERAPIADVEKNILDLVRGRQFDEALKELDKVKDKGVPASHPQVKLARVYIDLHRKAAAAATDKVSSDPFVVDPYAAVPQYHREIRGLVRVVGPTNRTIKVTYGKATINIRIPTLAQQLDLGKRLLPNYPWSALLRLRLARVCVRAGKPDDALTFFSEAIAIDGHHSVLSREAALERARTLVRAKRHDDAVRALRADLSRYPDDFLLHTALAHAYLAAGQHSKAVAAWNKSFSLNDNQVDVSATFLKAPDDGGAHPPLLERTELYNQVERSCVVVIVEHKHGGRIVARGSGSGFAISSDGLICTNFHVIAPSLGVDVPGSGISVRCKRGGKDVTIRHVDTVLVSPLEDIALLRVDPRRHPFRPLRLGSVKNVLPGEDIVVVGNPGLGGRILDFTITRGIISNRDRTFGPNHYIQTDAGINPGNSGGPMFNLRAQVIGMVTLKANIERTGFALHIDQVKANLPKCFPQSQ